MAEETRQKCEDFLLPINEMRKMENLSSKEQLYNDKYYN